MTILIDLDNTLNNLGEVLLKYCKTYCRNDPNAPENPKYENITSYDWFDTHYQDPWRFLEMKSFWDKVTIPKKTVEIVEKLAEDNSIYIVTATHFHKNLDYKINRMLSFFNPDIINENNVIIAQDKFMVKNDSSTFFIDDCIEQLENYRRYGVYSNTICYAQPWNVGYSPRFNTWDAIYRALI